MVINILLIIIFIQEASLQHPSKIISTKFSLLNNKYQIEIFLNPTPKTIYTRTISLNHKYLDLNNIELSDNSFIQNTSIQSISNKTIPVIEMKEQLNLFNNISVTIHFYNIKEYEEFSENSNLVPFAHLFYDINFSLVHQLFYQGQILTLSFGFSKLFGLGGNLYFGGIPNKEITSFPYFTQCKVNKTDVSWSCNLDRIYFDKNRKHYVNKHYMRFNTEKYFIEVPNDFLIYLKEEVFHSFILQNKCSFHNTTYHVGFACDCGIRNQMKNINIVIDGKVFSIEMEKLFLISDEGTRFEYCDLIIERNKKGDFFEMGNVFIGMYSSLFNYENDTVMFYSDKLFSEFKSDKKFSFLFIIDIIILSFGIFVNLNYLFKC